jgi:hypothetical protein
MKKAELSLVSLDRIEKHEGAWYSVWEGTCTKGDRIEDVQVLVKLIDRDYKQHDKITFTSALRTDGPEYMP